MDLILIQYLRGTAAMMVVYFHIADKWKSIGNFPISLLASVGEAGVDIFFVISGLIMWITTSTTSTNSIEFMKKRIIRVVPIYWLLTLGVTLVAIIKPEILSTTRFDLAHVLSSFLFIPWPHPNFSKYAPVIIPGWTLNYEMAFYLLFSICLLLPLWKRLFSVTVTLILIALVGYWFKPSGQLGYYTDSIVLEFALGIGIGVVYKSGFKPPFLISIGIALLGVVIFMAGCQADLPRIVKWGVPASLVVMGFVLYEKCYTAPVIPLFRLLGDASYSIYLTNLFVITALSKVLILASDKIITPNTYGSLVGIWGGLFSLLTIFAVTLVGISFYRLVEQPILRLFRKNGTVHAIKV